MLTFKSGCIDNCSVKVEINTLKTLKDKKMFLIKMECVKDFYFPQVSYFSFIGGTECADSERQQAESCHQNDYTEICPLPSCRWVFKRPSVIIVLFIMWPSAG